jgi:hypothetical protein
LTDCTADAAADAGSRVEESMAAVVTPMAMVDAEDEEEEEEEDACG